MSQSEQVRLNIQGGIATLSIHRPEAKNALSREIVDRIDVLLDQAAADPGIKLLTVRSQGDFAAGADIRQMVDCTPEQAKAFVFTDTFQKLAALPVPTLAAIEGYALGGGLELALACDFRIASSTAKMGLPETTLGIMPGAGGTVRLARLIGPSRAKEMIFMGRAIDAERASTWGLVNESVPAEDFEAAVQEWQRRLIRQSKMALAAAKTAVEQGASMELMQALKQETELWSGLFSTHDQKEVMRAFLEKRKPSFLDC